MAKQIHWILFPFIAVVAIGILVAFVGADEAEDCLVLPYISSFDEFRAQQLSINEKNESAFNIYLKFKVDYDYTVEISNLSLTGNLLKRIESTKVRILTDEKDSAITYTNASYPDPKNPKRTRYTSYTKSDAFREAKRIHHDLSLNKQLARPNRVAPPCSSAYIYDSDLIIQNQEDKNQYAHHKFHKSMSCFKIIQYDHDNNRKALISSHDGYTVIKGRFRSNEIVAAAYSNSLSINANANGAISLELLSSNFLVGKKIIESNSLTYKPADLTTNFIEPNRPIILRSQFCYKKLRELNFDKPESVYDIKSSKPFRTITRGFSNDKGGRAEILVAEARDYDNLHLHYTDSFVNKRKRALWPLQGVFLKLGKQQSDKFYISSMAIFKHNNIFRCQLVFRSPYIMTHLFYVNSELEADYSIEGDIIEIGSDLMAEPDDITYWSRCEKIISFYGFMYTIHHYNENIFKTESKWNILDESLFDYPIEAVHADGDVFYFFTKSTTVHKMIVDNSFGCKELRFMSKTTIHMSEFLGYSLKQFHTEGRYFSQKLGWQPKWETYPDRNIDNNNNDNPTTMSPEPDWPTTTTTTMSPEPDWSTTATSKPLIMTKSSDNFIWMYVGLGVLGLILLIVVVVMVYLVSQRGSVSSPARRPSMRVSK